MLVLDTFVENGMAQVSALSASISLSANLISLIHDIPTISANVVADAATVEQRERHISSTAVLSGSVFVGRGSYIGDFVTIRDSILLDDVLVGPCSEISRSIVFSGSRLSHKITMSDSIVGHDVNVGASVSIASPSLFNRNMAKLDKEIHIDLSDGSRVATGLCKFGAVIGDRCRIGSNVSTAPGLLLGRESIVYPNVFLRSAIYPSFTIIKLRQQLDIAVHNKD